MTHPSIPLVRESLLEPFVVAAKDIGVSVEKILRSVKLPGQLTGEPDLLLPELPCWQFVQSIARQEKLDNFGLLTARITTQADMEGVGVLFTGCINLHDILKRLCAIAPLISTVNHYVLEEEGSNVWLRQKGLRLLDDDRQVQLFEIAWMIQLVQIVTGPDWRPDEIDFTFDYGFEVDNATELNPSRIHYLRNYPAIAIPRELLCTTLPGKKTTNKSDNAITSLPTPESFFDTLRTAITPYLGDVTPRIDLAAEICGLHVRTLQRRLEEHGVSYSLLVEQARLKKAQTLMHDAELKLLDISMQVGYSEPATLSRAFRRWSGMTPREYRTNLCMEKY